MSPHTFIGTSGWNYPHWAGILYPERGPRSKWLQLYGEHFDTVEVNATFYRLPKPETFEKWRTGTPEGFLWAVKASRYITHIKKMRDAGDPLNRFLDAAEGLGQKLGPLLFQLPPSLVFDGNRFRAFCAELGKRDHRYAVEVRHGSWLTDEALEIMHEHNIALCIADTAGRFPFHEHLTADFVYVRLHGSRQLYVSSYTDTELRDWADRIKTWNRDAYIYFDNDHEGKAPLNALQLKSLLIPQ